MAQLKAAYNDGCEPSQRASEGRRLGGAGETRRKIAGAARGGSYTGPMIVAMRWLGWVSVVLALGCQNGDDASGGEATASVASTGGSTGGGETTTPTGGVVTTTVDTAEPVVCDTPEGCTAMAEGDLADVTLPFFRGTFCVSDAVKPGDELAISVTTCAHPCLTLAKYAFKWAKRCDADGCEAALAFYHPGVTGAACPADVFGEFDPAACVLAGPYTLGIQPMAQEGQGSLLLPFLTNADAAAIAGGEEGAALWTRVDSHAQAVARRIAISYAVGNDSAPASCGEGVAGCKCSSVGLE